MATAASTELTISPASPTNTPALGQSALKPDDPSFSFPSYTTFPPFYTLQPNHTTRARQLELWSSLVASYCAHHRLFTLSLAAPPPDLFTSPPGAPKRSLRLADTRTVLDYMARTENGGIIEWIPATGKAGLSTKCYIWWKTPGEWADALHGWVEATGQTGAVLTLYELKEAEGREWSGMDESMLRKVLGVLVKRGKAQVFGQEERAGVKFF